MPLLSVRSSLRSFERDALLDEFIEQGTVLEAAVSKELLYSIFIPSYENPMHDGAVIIRGGRLAAANAFLPLTATPDPTLAHGTRHRAAIGLSEESDAFVIVVSEENGSIAVAADGTLREDVGLMELRGLLADRFGGH